MKSIEERLRTAKHDCALMIAALTADDAQLAIEGQELSEALHATAIRVHEELHWLQQLPSAILNIGSPDDDEKRQGGAR